MYFVFWVDTVLLPAVAETERNLEIVGRRRGTKVLVGRV
jgi:hypothetical protein